MGKPKEGVDSRALFPAEKETKKDVGGPPLFFVLSNANRKSNTAGRPARKKRLQESQKGGRGEITGDFGFNSKGK